MEPEGFRRLMERSVNWPFKITTIATDRHLSIAKEIANNHPNVNHQYDVWHVAKSIRKKLHGKANSKESSDLAQWIPSIINHLWWSAASCGGSSDLMK